MGCKQVVTLAAMLIAQAVSAQSPSNLRSQLEGRYAAMRSAIESKDEAAIHSILADGVVNVDVDGNALNEAQMMKRLPDLPNDAVRQSHVTILSVRGDERAAVVKQRSVTSRNVKDSDGSEKRAVVSAVSRDNWLNENGSWRLARTVTLTLDARVDGKTLVHKRNPTAK
jgi:hypothetical protein